MMDKDKAISVLLVLALVFTVYNQVQLGSMNGMSMGVTMVRAEIIPTGIPSYGEELGISYDDVSPNNPGLADRTISVMKNLDLKLNLEGSDLERYIQVVSQISCEYCCGVESIIVTKDNVAEMDAKIEAAIASGEISSEDASKYRRNAGDAACGCAHSFAMRGLAKYLILNSDLSDDEILSELAKWKVLYFPEQMTAKAEVMKEKGIEVDYANLGSNQYRGIEQGVSGGMVGGC